ncbi:MAG: hypothetical protein WBM77_03770 [Maribacter sp.]|uniref:hypothetical protein n=1 Tax=Eudoraea sp. TaxID=1979955 RepID=UPI003C72D273
MSGGNKPVTITLEVRAKDLYTAIPQPLSTNQTELDTYCGLSDNNLTAPGKIPPGGTLNDYCSDVYSTNKVIWKGKNSGSDGYRVLIDSISNNPSFFASDPPGQSGIVTATLKDGIDGVVDTYTINFSIDPPGNGAAQSYSLDPKLRGNPK